MEKSEYLKTLKPGRGHLNTNHYKKKSKHPDMVGFLKLPDGSIFQVAAWKNLNRRNEAVFSLVLEDPDTDELSSLI
jgi:hypothetical protein